jgi:hypothetical protein
MRAIENIADAPRDQPPGFEAEIGARPRAPQSGGH